MENQNPQNYLKTFLAVVFLQGIVFFTNTASEDSSAYIFIELLQTAFSIVYCVLGIKTIKQGRVLLGIFLLLIGILGTFIFSIAALSSYMIPNFQGI